MTNTNNTAAKNTDTDAQAQPGIANQKKDPSDWVTGDEPMTEAQASYLKTLSEQPGTKDGYEAGLSKAEASKRIDALRKQAGARVQAG
jgi:hypothetical protein